MTKKENALIICNADPGNLAFLKREAATASLIICADGGADIALKAGIKPHVIIGDFDSVSSRAKKTFKTTNWQHITRQDNTDLEKALDYTLSTKIKQITIVCSTGGRLDFTLSNFLSSFNYLGTKAITFKSDTWRAVPIIKSQKFTCKKGQRVSIIPFGDIYNLTLKGLKYPLKNVHLKVGQTAVSNVATASIFSVNFKQGNALVYIED